MSYPFTNAINYPTPIGGNLNGEYIHFDHLPDTIKILISNPKYVVLVRETTNTTTSGGGRTSGTMWYNKQILGFTVEDAIRNKKIDDKTAIPDTIQNANTFDGIPSNIYNIVLSTYTGKEFIRKSFYKGEGMRISSKSDPSGYNIYEADVFTDKSFSSQDNGVAFSGAFIHQGNSEGSSSGCVIFSKTRNKDKTITLSTSNVQDLNKYLQLVKIIGKGKLQQFVIINLFEFPDPPPSTKTTVIVIDDTTTQPIPQVKIQDTTTQPIPQVKIQVQSQPPPPISPNQTVTEEIDLN